MAEPYLRSSHCACVDIWQGKATNVSPFRSSKLANQLWLSCIEIRYKALVPNETPYQGNVFCT